MVLVVWNTILSAMAARWTVYQ